MPLLRIVEPKDVLAFPDRVTIDGVEVPVVVEGNFKPPGSTEIRAL